MFEGKFTHQHSLRNRSTVPALWERRRPWELAGQPDPIPCLLLWARSQGGSGGIPGLGAAAGQQAGSAHEPQLPLPGSAGHCSSARLHAGLGAGKEGKMLKYLVHIWAASVPACRSKFRLPNVTALRKAMLCPQRQNFSLCADGMCLS